MYKEMYKNFIFTAFSKTKFCKNTAEIVCQPNFFTCSRCYAARKRFYKNTNVLYNDGKFEITLDQRKLKTPKGNLFYVESEPLALAVAAEWDAQKTHIIPGKMHLFGLCSSVIDNFNKLSKKDMVHNIIKYLDTDTVLYTSSEEDELYDIQQKEWLPILDWFCKRYEVEIEPSRKISGPEITPHTRQVLTKHLLSYDLWAVFGFNFVVEALKSIILGLACAERHISVEKAVSLSRLEEEYQGKRWGRIEWSHELNQQDIQARVASGILFIYANSSYNMVKNKAEILDMV